MELSAEKRETTGTKVKSLRERGLVPAVIFSKKSSTGKKDVENIQVDARAFKKLYAEAGHSTLVSILIEGQDRDVLIKEVQLDPVYLQPIHISFYEVDMSQPIEADIPVVLINAEDCEPVKSKTGILIQVLDQIKVKCLPKYIPQEFEVDVMPLKAVEDSLMVKDAIKVNPDHIELLVEPEEVIVKVDYAEQMAVEEETSADVGDVAVISEEEAKARAEAEKSEEKESDQ